MRRILRGRYIWNQVPFLNRPFCSPPQKNSNNKPATISSNGNEPSSSSLGQYSEQYKALNNLDFMTAAKILFTDQPKKKKFGYTFTFLRGILLNTVPYFSKKKKLHYAERFVFRELKLVLLDDYQIRFPPAVYLVSQYARSEMKKMDAELELKKQAEFEAQAKEMELKKTEERAADPVLREVNERLSKLEETIKEFVVESKKQSKDAQIEASKIQLGLEAGKSSKGTTGTSTGGKNREPAPTTPASQHEPKSGESREDLQ